MTKSFIRTIEDFVCEHCGASVEGTGYTNHCPRCLYSKHVDINPGDRLAACGGLMEPVSAVLRQGEWRIIHRCLVCGQVKNNISSKKDDFNMLVRIS